jgi:archaemetzincin
LQKIIISPIENIDACNCQLLGQEIYRTFGFQTEVKSFLQNVNFAYDLTREQYHSTAILEKLANTSPSFAIKVIAITNVDLFIPILTHVYGEAQLAGKACIVSTFRLQEGLSAANIEKEFENRIVKEALHELGHTFNLRHCRDKSCIMHYCRSIRDVDRKSDQLCRYCKILLEDELKKLKGKTPDASI